MTSLSFFLRSISLTKSVANTYGSRACAKCVRGGGPLILGDSPELVQRVLHKIGFIDSGMNECLEEGVDVFAHCTVNARALRKARLDIGDSDTINEKISEIRKVHSSNSFAGWSQPPPSDVQIRRRLVKPPLLPVECATGRGVRCTGDTSEIKWYSSKEDVQWACPSIAQHIFECLAISNNAPVRYHGARVHTMPAPIRSCFAIFRSRRHAPLDRHSRREEVFADAPDIFFGAAQTN